MLVGLFIGWFLLVLAGSLFLCLLAGLFPPLAAFVRFYGADFGGAGQDGGDRRAQKGGGDDDQDIPPGDYKAEAFGAEGFQSDSTEALAEQVSYGDPGDEADEHGEEAFCEIAAFQVGAGEAEGFMERERAAVFFDDQAQKQHDDGGDYRRCNGCCQAGGQTKLF